MTPLERYNDALESGELTPDDQQKEVVLLLTHIHEQLLTTKLPSEHKAGFLGRLFPSTLFSTNTDEDQLVPGLYLWGGVGRGKTLLTDMFYESVPIEQKSRLHFHRFMKSIHDELKLLKGEEDPLILIADKWIKNARLLVLDEMHVNDITDAMLLGKLLTALFERGLTLVTTSNVPPDGLYKDGLQRDRFLPAIDEMKSHTRVYSMEGDTDYRLRVLENANTYFDSGDSSVTQSLKHSFAQLCTNSASVSREPLLINTRELAIVQSGNGVAWFEFDTLCNTPRSTYDYIEIATLFHSVIISSVPVLDDNDNDSARRFVNLIDELYDRSVNLIVSASAAPEALYVGNRLEFEFVRAASRLREMQTTHYFSRPHLI